MRKLTPQEQQWVESAYPLVKQTMESYNLSENDTIDWHGELSVALCEAVIEISPYSHTSAVHIAMQVFLPNWLEYISRRLEDRAQALLQTKQYQVKEIPSGLRPQQAAGRGRSL